MHKQYLALMLFASTCLGGVSLAETGSRADLNYSTSDKLASSVGINGWWKITTTENVYLFKPESVYLFKDEANKSSGEYLMTSDMQLVFRAGGIYSNSIISYDSLKKIRTNTFNINCPSYVVTTIDDAETKGSSCSTSSMSYFLVSVGDKKAQDIISRIEGNALDLNANRKSRVDSAIFKFKSPWLLDGGDIKEVEVIRDKNVVDSIVANSEKRATELKIAAIKYAEMHEAQQKAVQEKIRSRSLRELAVAAKGSEDSCQNTNYSWNGNLANDVKINCQMSGDGLSLKDLRSAGWIVTNVSKMSETRDNGNNVTQYVLVVKKVK